MITLPIHSIANPTLGSALATNGPKDSFNCFTFSVGTQASSPDEYITSHKNNPLVRVTVDAGVATFSYPQTHPYVGIGDRVVTSGHTFYLNEKISTSQWRVKTNNGSNPDNFDSEDLISIDKTFPDILTAIDGPTSGANTLIGVSDLTNLGSTLRIATYKMHDNIGTNVLTIEGWTTSERSFVKIFSPTDISKECNSNNRHNGAYTGAFNSLTGYLLEKDQTGTIAIDIRQDYTEVEGIVLDGGTSGGGFILIDSTTSALSYKVINCILTDCDNGVRIENGSVAAGNIIFNCPSVSILDSDGTGYYYNNTIFDSGVGISSASGPNGISINNLIQNCTTCMSGFPAGKIFTTISEDGTGIGSTALSVVMRDESVDDFHLDFASGSTALNGGTSLFNDEIFSVTRDIDGSAITGSGWHIGAHRFVPTAYFAIGDPQSDISVAGNFSINSSGVMTFDTAQTDDRLSVGCVVNGTYYLYKRISDTVWWVTNGLGVSPPSVGSTAITTITFPFVNGYEALFDDGGDAGVQTIIGSYDLVSSGVRVGLSVVDGAISEGIKIHDDFVTDENHNIKIFTPNDVGINCNSSRRHSGVFDNSLPYIDSGTLLEDSIVINKSYTVVEGLQITGLGHGVKIVAGTNISVYKNIIKEVQLNAISIESNEPTIGNYIYNNIIYRASGIGINVSHISNSMDGSIYSYLYNNTIIDSGTYGIKIDVRGDITHSNVVKIKNNIVLGSVDGDIVSASGPSEDIDTWSNYTSDESIRLFRGKLNSSSFEIQFVDSAHDNYHVTLNNLLSMNNSIDLGPDVDLQVTDDIDGEIRLFYELGVSAGADNWSPSSETIASFSIGGTNPGVIVSTTCTIKNNILTFSNPTNINVGVGDRVSYGSGDLCYLSERGDADIWYVTDNNGAGVPDITNSLVTDISRVSNNLNDAIDDSGLSEIESELALPGRDLVAAGINKLNIWCYDDGVADPGNVTIDNWSTDASHRIFIQTPWNESQSNKKHRHSGIYNSNGLEINPSVSTCVVINNSYVIFSGFKITPLSNSDDAVVIASTSEGSAVHGNIIKDSNIGVLQQGAGGSNISVLHNIIYDVVATGIDAKEANVFNNTIVGSANGIIADTNVNATNNICQDSSIAGFSGSGTFSKNISDDTSLALVSGNRQNMVIVFKDKALKDYHLSRADWSAINTGDIISTLEPIPFNYDIDGDLVNKEWSIGAYNYNNLEELVLKFSVGRNQANLRSGSSFDIISGVAIFSEAQINPNLGIGDRIEYNSTLECYLFKKIDQTNWEVRTKYGDIPPNVSSASLHRIEHAFTYLNDLFPNSGSGSDLAEFIGTVDNPFYDLSSYKVQIDIIGYKTENLLSHGVVRVNGWTVDSEHYLRIYTPTDTINECNSSQRHAGNFDASEDKFRLLNVTSANTVTLESDYTVIEGLTIESTGTGRTIQVNLAYGCRISGNILRTPLIGVDVLSNPPTQTARTIINNNIIIEATTNGINSGGDDVIYNNTVDGAGSIGINNTPTDFVANNIVQNSGTGYADNTNIENCIADDTSPGSSNGNQSSVTLTFEDLGNKNYNLVASDYQARGTGKILKGNLLYAFSKDSVGVDRGRLWDVGALEFVVTNYAKYSVGKNINDFATRSLGYLTYSVSTINNTTIMTFSEDQTNESLGAGDEVFDFGPTVGPDYGGSFPEGCLLKEKVSDNAWIVTDYFGQPIQDTISGDPNIRTGGLVSAIRRAYNDLGEAINASYGIFSDRIGSSDLISLELKIDILGYDDRAHTYPSSTAHVYQIISDPDFNLTIRASNDLDKEVNSENRHFGKIGSGYMHEVSGNTPPTPESNYGIFVNSSDYVEIDGIIVKSNENNPGDGIKFYNSHNCIVSSSILAFCKGNGISFEVFSDSKDYVINNLIYKCQGSGVKAGNNVFSTTSYTYIYNNTIIRCLNGIHLVTTSDPSGHIIYSTGNLIQDSYGQDFVSDNHTHTNKFVLNNNISRDFSSDRFSGSINFSNELIIFTDKAGDSYEPNSVLDKSVIDSSLDLRSDPNISFNNDITGNIRDNDKWDIGAFETVDVVGVGDMDIPSLEISVSASAGDTVPTLILHLREDIDPSVSSIIQFLSIEGAGGLNEFLSNNINYDAFNLIIYVQGGKEFTGTLSLRGNGEFRTVLIETRPTEKELGPGSLIYSSGPMVDDSSSQSIITFNGLKIYSDDSVSQPYLLNDAALTTNIEFINSIVQVNEDAIISNIPSAIVSFRNSILIFRNSSTASPANMYLVKNNTDGNSITNSMVLSYFDGSDLTFITTNRVAPLNDEVRNSLSYNYGTDGFLFGNNPLTTSFLKENFGPLFQEVVIGSQLFTPSIIMKEDFNPLNESPIFNAGSNNYISGIDVDIIGNARVFDSGPVDIGPYELEIRQIMFSSDNIRQIFQDKLQLNTRLKAYISNKNIIYKGLYNQFITSPENRVEFSRESKIIIQLREFTNDFSTFIDKRKKEVASAEAYYDDGTMSIIITKIDNLIGGLFSNIFEDGRYSFFFDELNRSIKIYENNTFDKGLSGTRNAVKNVKFGGVSVI